MRILYNIFRIIFLALFVLFPLHQSIGQENYAETKNAKIDILLAEDLSDIDNEFVIGLKFKLTPGWHIYWKNPGDSGLPPEINWNLPEGLEFREILWPHPEVAPLDPLTSYGYYDEVVLPIRFFANKTFSGDKSFSASISFLICDEICIPEETDIDINLSKLSLLDKKNSEKIIDDWIKRIPQKAPFNVRAQISNETFKISWDNLQRYESVYFYPEQNGLINYSANQIFKINNNESYLTIDRPIAFKEDTNFVSGVLQLSQNGSKNYFHVSSKLDKVSFIEVNKTKPLNFFLAIFLAFLGGIILNAMPCVFPVIALKVMSLINESGKSNSWKHGLIFTLGIEISMLILLITTIVVKSFGQFVGWGWQLQSSLMSTLLALLFFAIGLILISRVELGNFLTRLGNFNINKSGYSNSFLLGFLTVIVATPCTGPYMGAAIGWGITQPIIISSIIFLFLGLGIAFPTLILSIIPQRINILPKPGKWMGYVSQIMGIPMFLTSFWLAWVVFRQTGNEGIIVLAAATLLILFSLIMLKFSSRNIKISSLFFALASVILVVIFIPEQKDYSAKNVVFGEKWSSERVRELRNNQKDILLNFTADWCLTCKVNERLVLNSKEFISLVENGEIEYLIADWTRYDSAITAELEKYERAGVPLYLYWSKDSDDVKILPALLTKSILYDHLKM